MNILKRILHAAGAALLAALLCLACAPGRVQARAAGAYDFTIEQFAVEMQVHEDRSVDVEEHITVYFEGYDSHGIIRDLPLDRGVRYRDVYATCDNDDFSPYTELDDISFLSLYLRGDGLVQGQRRSYTVSYTMLLPDSAEEGYLPLDVVGFGWQATMYQVTAQVTLPAAPDAYAVYSGRAGAQGNDCNVAMLVQDNVVTLTAEVLPEENGITLDLQFAAGVMGSNTDRTPFAVLGVGLLLLLAAVAVKLLVCRQPILTVTVNLTAPEEMDPLMMGKLIDHKVDSEDLGAMVFYLADRGHLSIDLSEGEDDPILIKGDDVPEDAPNYIKTFFKGLFQSGDEVRFRDLNNTFYKTAERVINEVNSRTGHLNRRIGNWMKLLFWALSALLLGGLGYLLPRLLVYHDCSYLYGPVMGAFAFAACWAAAEYAQRLQFRKSPAYRLGVAALGLLVGGVAALICAYVPNPAMGRWASALIVLFCAVLGGFAALFSCRTQEYNDRLGHILGFRQFIEVTEKDRIAVLLEEQPQLYYHILPYAQVLGVTDAWTDKFEGLDLQPPTYARGSIGDGVMTYVVWSNMYRRMNSGLAQNMVSRPSSSGSGSHSGGFGGGFGGGGFGGGGGRGC